MQSVGADRTQQRTHGQCVECDRRKDGGAELTSSAGERKGEEEQIARGLGWPRWCTRSEAMPSEQAADVLGSGGHLHPAHVAAAPMTSLKVSLEHVSQKPRPGLSFTELCRPVARRLSCSLR